MAEPRKPRGSDLTPEQKAKIEELKVATRTPEARARHAEIRAKFADRPGLEELVRRGEVNPARMTTMGGVGALHHAMAEVQRIRESKGITLGEVARRSGMAVPSLSRLGAGKNENFTFETLARYAGALGLDLEIVVRERLSEDEPHASTAEPNGQYDGTVELQPLSGTPLDPERLAETIRNLEDLLAFLGSSADAR